MNVGNPRAAFALAVIALVAVVFAGAKLFAPHSELRQAGTSASSDGTRVETSLPQSVFTNPFFHKALLKSAPAAKESAATHIANDSSSGARILPPAIPYWNDTKPLPPKPVENTGASQQSKPSAPKKLSVTLNAVVASGEKFASFVVDGVSLEPSRAGARIGGTVKVVQIGDDFAVLKSASGTKKISVGEQIEI